MPAKPPAPLVQAFVVCRKISKHPETKETMLVAPFSAFTPPEYPASMTFSVYAHLTSARGRYAISLQLEDVDGEVVWAWDTPKPVEESDPLKHHRITLTNIVVAFPRAGRYSLNILANGDELSRHVLMARLASEAQPDHE